MKEVSTEQTASLQALKEAERIVNETTLTIEGVAVNLSLLWDELQGTMHVQLAELQSVVWATKSQLETCAERLDEASDLLEDLW